MNAYSVMRCKYITLLSHYCFVRPINSTFKYNASIEKANEPKSYI